MTDYSDLELLLSAARFAKQRYPDHCSVVSAARFDTGSIYHGVWVDASVDAAALCAEAGPICRAHEEGRRIIAVVSIGWDAENKTATVLPSCGVCQERLAYFGLDVWIAVAGDMQSGSCDYRTLRSLRPNYWLPEVDSEEHRRTTDNLGVAPE